MTDMTDEIPDYSNSRPQGEPCDDRDEMTEKELRECEQLQNEAAEEYYRDLDCIDYYYSNWERPL
jgi:hypothetical protein